MDGIFVVSSRAGWEHVLLPANISPELGGFGKGFVDGYIGHFSEQILVDRVRQTAIPAVDISSALPDSGLPRVVTDEVAVGRLAATHLLSLGLPRFGFVGAADDYPSLARSKGFEETVRAAGRTCHTFVSGANIDDQALNAPPNDMLSWVRNLPTPIGMLASSDIFGLQLLAVCRKFNITVPKDVAVLGVGNDDLLCNIANPPLTSIALPTQRIGFDGAEMLSRLMDGKKLKETIVLIPPVAVISRQSSALPAIFDHDVAAAISYIALHAQEHLQVADVLLNVSVSRSSLDQRFLKILGRTPATEIRRAQIELAKTILSETQEQMPQVAIAAGFLNSKQLSTTFHREVGVTPTAYRRQRQGLVR